MNSTAAWWSGYDRRSLAVLGLLGLVYLAAAVVWHRYIDLSRGMDWLLAGIWAGMTALLCWRVDLRRDVARAAVGFVGGLAIEAWGTHSQLWTYWTAERPPVWILPAWPVAALTIDRLARLLDPLLPARLGPVGYWTLVPAFVVWMSWFAWPTAGHRATQVAIVAMGLVLVWPGNRREDLLLFLAGTGLGVFLEYWGTSRWCWSYYTHEIPPGPAVVAHGFASVAFARGAAWVDRWMC